MADPAPEAAPVAEPPAGIPARTVTSWPRAFSDEVDTGSSKKMRQN